MTFNYRHPFQSFGAMGREFKEDPAKRSNLWLVLLIIVGVSCLIAVILAAVYGTKYMRLTDEEEETTTDEAGQAPTTNGNGAANGEGNGGETPPEEPTTLETDWACVTGVKVPLRVNAEGNIQCLSTDGKNCPWGDYSEGCNLDNIPENLDPLTCGKDHKQHWASHGYDAGENHWCNRGLRHFEIEEPPAYLEERFVGGSMNYLASIPTSRIVIYLLVLFWITKRLKLFPKF